MNKDRQLLFSSMVIEKHDYSVITLLGKNITVNKIKVIWNHYNTTVFFIIEAIFMQTIA